MRIVNTYTFTDSLIQIPIEAGNNYHQIVYTVAGQCLFPRSGVVHIAQSTRVPIQKTK